MPQVPKQQQQVQLETPRVATPPSVDHSGNLRAMNADFAANQNMAEAVGGAAELLQKHAQEKIRLKNESVVADLDTNAKRDINTLLYDNTPETIKINNQDVIRPKGLINRQLSQADGSLNEYRQKSAELTNRYLNQIKDPAYRNKLGISLNNYIVSKEDDVVKHEVKQTNDDVSNRIESNIKQQITFAASIDNPKDLATAINGVISRQEQLNQSKYLDPNTSDLNIKKTTSDLVDSSVTNTLFKSGDLSKAQGLLDSVKDKIGLDSYNTISKKIGNGFKNMKEQAVAQARETRTIDRYNYLSDVIAGKIDWTNADKVITEVGAKDPALAEAVGRIVKSGGQVIPSTLNEAAYMNTVKTMIDMDDKQQVSDFLLKTLNENGGKIGMDRLSILVGTAKQRHDELSKPVQSKSNNFIKAAIDSFEKSNIKLAPAMFMNFMHVLTSPDHKGKTFEQIKQESMSKAIVDKYPEVGGMQTIPNKISKPNQSVDSIYSGVNLLKGYEDDESNASEDRSSE